MRRILVLCRHGNTFNPGEKVVMVGAQQDLPLTPVGKAQAAAIGQALKNHSLVPQRIITGPLRRTRECAEIISELVGVTAGIGIDERLTELDYGAWGGLSDHEIRQQWGDEPLERWQAEAIRPEGVTFTPGESELEREAREVLRECSAFEGVTLMVTSNGRLREFARVLGSAPNKVRTGHVCVLESLSSGDWQVLCWDCEPAALSRF
jgi:broad specificity phosphatase PhoE